MKGCAWIVVLFGLFLAGVACLGLHSGGPNATPNDGSSGKGIERIIAEYGRPDEDVTVTGKDGKPYRVIRYNEAKVIVALDSKGMMYFFDLRMKPYTAWEALDR